MLRFSVEHRTDDDALADVTFGHASSCPPMNDDQTALTTLISCIDCARTMRIEKIDPDGKGKDIVQYRCGRCGRIERIRLVRRTWPSPRRAK
jgi:hypothetical protein